MRRDLALVGLALTACGRIGFRRAPADAPTDAPDGSPSACALPTPWDLGATYDRVLYVATTGSDTNDGSEGAPLATIAAAIATATAGTKIDVAAGVYPAARATDLAGEAARPIAIVGEPGAIIDDQGKGDVGVDLYDSSYVVVENLTIRNTLHGIYVDASGTASGGVGAIVRGVTVEGASSVGIKTFWTDQVFIEDSRVDSTTDTGVYVVGTHGGVIARNTIHSANVGIEVVSGSTDLLVQGNELSGGTGPELWVGGPDSQFVRPPEVYEASRIHVISNVVSGGGAPALEIDDADGAVVSHNTFVSPKDPVFAIVHENPMPTSGARDGSLDGNLVAFSAAAITTFVKVSGTSQLDTFTLHQNLWWAADDPAFPGPTLPSPLVETGSIVGIDPEVTADGHLAAGSPAVGLADPTPGLIDIDGTCTTGSGPTTPGADQP